MANNNNIVKIGTALKWRGLFELDKKYYQENIVTVLGCVFRCSILQAQYITPVEFDDEGHMYYVNPEVWDVVVDYSYYYNFAVDTRNLTEQTLAYVKKLDNDIKNLQAEQKDQWMMIADNREVNKEQWDELYRLRSRVADTETSVENLDKAAKSHHDLLQKLSEQETVHDEWLNRIEKELNGDIIREDDTHQSVWGMLKWLQNLIYQLYYKDPEITSTSVVDNGIWDNELIWEDAKLWNNAKQGGGTSSGTGSSCNCGPMIADMQSQIDNLQQKIKELEERLSQSKKNAIWVAEYNEENTSVKIEGALAVESHNPSDESLSLEIDGSNLVYRDGSLGLEFL